MQVLLTKVPAKYLRPLKFLTIGGSLYIVSALLLYFFTEVSSMEQQVAYLVQTLITYVSQFVLNAVFTWSDRKATVWQNVLRVAKFIPAKIVIWGLNQVVFGFWLLFDMHYQIANALSVLLIMGVNYFVFDKFIFRK